MEIAVILQDIRSLHNVGSIFRTADTAGVSKVFLYGITASPLDRFGHPRPQVAKVALGADSFIPWEKVTSGTQLIKRLQKEGYIVIAVEQSKTSKLYTTALKTIAKKKKVALIMGNEVKGLKSAIINSADLSIEIPMFGQKESLNVAVAFGVVAFHLRSLLK